MSVTILFTTTIVRSYTIVALTMIKLLGFSVDFRVGFQSDIVGYLRLTAWFMQEITYKILNRNYRGTSPYVTI